jgi:hypothetical protein
MEPSQGTGSGTDTRTRDLGIGLAASVVQMLMMIPGYNDDKDGFQTGAYAVVFLISLVVAVVVFMFVVPKGSAMTALVLGILAVLTVLAFWLGITLPIAAGAVVLGTRERAAGRRVGLATAGAVLGAVAAVLTVLIIVGDAMSN